MMDELKVLAFQICVTVVSFGLIRSVLPTSKYEKYMRLILNLIFMVLIITAIKNLSFDPAELMPNEEMHMTSTTIEGNLKQAVGTYINDCLNKNDFKAVCSSVEIENHDGKYLLKRIELSVKEGQDDVVSFVCEITGLDKEQIYVSDG